MFTDEQLKNYAGCEAQCPFCGSHDISGGRVDISSRTAWQDVDCNACDKRWQDGYKLTAIADLGDKEFNLQALPAVETA